MAGEAAEATETVGATDAAGATEATEATGATGSEAAGEPATDHAGQPLGPAGDAAAAAAAAAPDADRGAAAAAEAAGEAGGEPAAAEPPAIPLDLIHEAFEYGLTEAQARTFPSAEALDQALTALDAASAARAAAPEPGLATRKPPAAGAGGAPPEGEAAAAKAFELELNEDEVSPEVAKALKQLAGHFGPQVAELREAMEKAAEATRVESQLRAAAEFDTLVDGAGDEWKAKLGAGGVGDLRRTSAAYRNRMQVLRTMDDLAIGEKRRGDRPSPNKALFERALRAAFPDVAKAEARGEVKGEIDARRRQAAARPRAARATAKRGLQSILEDAERFARDNPAG